MNFNRHEDPRLSCDKILHLLLPLLINHLVVGVVDDVLVFEVLVAHHVFVLQVVKHVEILLKMLRNNARVQVDVEVDRLEWSKIAHRNLELTHQSINLCLRLGSQKRLLFLVELQHQLLDLTLFLIQSRANLCLVGSLLLGFSFEDVYLVLDSYHVCGDRFHSGFEHAFDIDLFILVIKQECQVTIECAILENKAILVSALQIVVEDRQQ